MNVLVTGAAGRIGEYTVRDLAAAGHRVLGVDVQRGSDLSSPFLRVDLTRAGEVYQALALAGAEAVVHLGAWANAGQVPDTRTYTENVAMTFNVFQACADLAVRRIVWASSNQVYGLAEAPPVYVPLDEDHPLRPGNCYALSKLAGEQAADYFATTRGMNILSFRFMSISSPAQVEQRGKQLLTDPSHGRSFLWTLGDARDAALACRLALEKDEVPSGPYSITGGLALEEPAEALVRRYFGDKTEIRSDLSRHLSPLSCARAEAAFGYRPRHLWCAADKGAGRREARGGSDMQA